MDRKVADAVEPEDDLHHDGTADQHADVHPKHGHHRLQRRPDDVTANDVAPGKSLRPRKQHPALVGDLEHARPHDPAVGGGVSEGQRAPGQDQMPRPAQRILRERDVGGRRKDVDLEIEEIEKSDSKQELRHRHTNEREKHRQPVLKGARTKRRNNPDRQPEKQPEQHPPDGERDRHRESIEDRGEHRLLVLERVTEVGRPVEDSRRLPVANQVRAVEEVQVLTPDRLVETHPVANFRDRLGRSAPRHGLNGGIRRNQEKQRVGQAGDDEDQQAQPGNAPNDHVDHSVASPARGSRASRNASPTRLKAIVVDRSAAPGTAIIHGAVE